jgi:AsmA protein
MNRWVVIAGYTGFGLACALLVVITILVLGAPTGLVRDRLVQEVKAQTGRDLVVSGPVSLVMFPRIAVSLSNVALSAPPGMTSAPTARIDRLDAEIGLFSLLSGGSVRRLVLTRPAFELHVDAQGRRSWDIPAAGQPAPRTASGAPARSSSQPTASAAQLEQSLAGLFPISVRIVDGNARYVDEPAGVRQTVKSLNFEADVGDASGPLVAKGSLDLNGERLAFEVTVTPVRAVLLEQKARTTLKLGGRPVGVAFDGVVDFGAGLAGLEGPFSLRSTSLPGLASWLGGDRAVIGDDSGGVNLSGALSSARGTLSVSRLNGTVTGGSLEGTLSVDTKGVRPLLTGNLQLSELDLGRILIGTGSAAAPAPPPAAPAPAPAKRLSDTAVPVQAPAPPPQAGAGSAGWSDERLDFALLALADADLTVSAGRLVHKDLKTGPSRVALKLKDKVADVTLEDIELYGGRGRGRLNLNNSAETPTVGVSLVLEGISALPLLKDAMGFEWLEGRTNITLAVAGRGASERQIVETLTGKMDIAAANGSVNGFDVGKALRGLEQGRVPDLATSPTEKTPFSEFAASYTIASGIAQNKDLRLVSPSVRVSGSGNINLAARTVDYTVSPKIQGGGGGGGAGGRPAISLAGVEVPIRIEGPWEKPNFSITGQERLLENALKGLFGGAGGRGGILDGLFGR